MENFVPYSTFFVILLLHIYHVMYMTFDYFHFIYSNHGHRLNHQLCWWPG